MTADLILMAAGLLTAFAGMVLYFMKRDYEYRHTVEVKGTVTDSIEKPIVMQDEEGNVREGINHLTYFTYEIDGKPYSTARYTVEVYRKGDEIMLKCNPDNMKDVVEASVEGKDPKKYYSVMMLGGFILLAAGFIMNQI